MKKHRLIHDSDEVEDVPTKQLKMDPHVSKTTPKEKSKFDMKVAKFFYACNIPFNAADSPAFKEMIEMLHVGDRPPTRKEMAGQLLDKVHSELIVDAKDDLADKDVTLGVDGWSNVNNDAIIAFTVQRDPKSTLYIPKTPKTIDIPQTTWQIL